MTLVKNKLEAALKKAIYRGAERPILNCVNFATDGSICATDSHVALRVRDYHELYTNPLNLNLLTFEPDSGNFPDMGRVMPTLFNFEGDIEISELKQVFPILKAAGRNTINLVIDPEDEKLTLSTGTSLSVLRVTTGPNPIKGDLELNFSCNACYLFNAFTFFTTVDDGLQSVSFKYVSRLRPFMFTADRYDYLVAPVRKY